MYQKVALAVGRKIFLPVSERCISEEHQFEADQGCHGFEKVIFMERCEKTLGGTDSAGLLSLQL